MQMLCSRRRKQIEKDSHIIWTQRTIISIAYSLILPAEETFLQKIEFKNRKGTHSVSGKLIQNNTKTYLSKATESRRKKIILASKQRKKVTFNMEKEFNLASDFTIAICNASKHWKTSLSTESRKWDWTIFVPSQVVFQMYRPVDILNKQGYEKWADVHLF